MSHPLFAKDTGFVSRSVELDGVTYAYQVFVPSSWSADRQWPVIFFLHGAGERGDDLELVKKHGPPRLIAEGRQFPAIVVTAGTGGSYRIVTYYRIPTVGSRIRGAGQIFFHDHRMGRGRCKYECS